MQLRLITFSGDINVSLQTGDMAHACSTNTNVNAGFTFGASSRFLGIVTAVYNDGNALLFIPPHSIVIVMDETSTAPPVDTDFIMFSKNRQVNTSGLKGYYAEVELRNYSSQGRAAELFSVGAEVSESSK